MSQVQPRLAKSARPRRRGSQARMPPHSVEVGEE
jgi:hypothetical protein